MKRRPDSFAVAMGASLLAHALLWFGAAEFGIAPRLPGGAERATPDTLEVEPAALLPPIAEPVPEELDLGEQDATGYASHAAGGRSQQVAREGEVDQAYLSLDPVGPGERGEASTPRTHGTGGAGTMAGVPAPPVPAAAALLPTVSESPTPFGPPSQALLPRRPTHRKPAVATPAAAPDPPMIAVAGADQAPPAANARPPEASVTLAPAQPVEFAPPPAGPAPGSVPGESRPAADPAPPSDSEVDPFSTLGTAEFSTGRLDVRFGRKVKTRRPKIGLAGKIDLFQGRGARVVLKISVDATGKVTDVGIIKSSGSNEIDQPCRVAVYDWWFEPKRDAAGNAVADDFQFTIVWH